MESSSQHHSDDRFKAAQQQLEAWRQAIVGQDWEVLWKDDDDEENVAAGSESAPAHTVTRAPSDDDMSMSSDDGIAKPPKPIPLVKVETAAADDPVDEKEDGEIDSEDEAFEPTPIPPVPAKEESVAADDPVDAKKDGGESDETFEDGWYLGRVESFLEKYNEQGQALFHIQFVGDETVYELPLIPEWVRPCAQRWIIRSVALLLRSDDDMGSLPPTTRLPADNEALAAMALYMKRTAVSLQDATLENGAAPTLWPETSTVQNIRLLRYLAAEQVYLRSRLGPAEKGDSYSYPTGSALALPPPSEAYLNHLVQCLEQVQAACTWVEETYAMLTRVYRNEPRTVGEANLVTRDDLLRRGLAVGQRQLQTLAQLAPSAIPPRRKRKEPSTPVSNDQSSSPRIQKRQKRQRLDALYQESPVTHPSSSPTSCVIDVRPYDLWTSTDVVSQFVSRTLPKNAPWYYGVVGAMLRSVSVNLVDKYRAWEDCAVLYLGRKESVVRGNPVANGRTPESHPTEEGNTQKSYVSYQMILSLVQKSKEDPVLAWFDFDRLRLALRQKMEDIDSFEKECWTVIGCVLEDHGYSKWKPDPILEHLRCILEKAGDPNSNVGNVEPLGLTDLTREVIERATVYRQWFLDLQYAESRRERRHFIEGVVSRLSRLHPLPSKAVKSPNDLADLSLTMTAMEHRVRALSRNGLDHSMLFNGYKTRLNDRQGVPENYQWLEEKVDVDSAVVDLRKASVLSVEEEKMYCRKDVVTWLRAAESLLSVARPSFSIVEKVHTDLEALLSGQPPTRALHTRELRPNPDIDDEIRVFVAADLEPFRERYLVKVQELFKQGSRWNARYSTVASALRAHGNLSVAPGEASTLKTASMIDLKRIEDLLKEYDSLPVALSTARDSLDMVYKDTSTWASDVQTKLFDQESIDFDEALRFAVTANAEGARPRGVVVHPTRQVLGSLVDLLRWYQDVRRWVTKREYLPRPYGLMSEGIEVVEAFGASKQSDGWFQATSEELSGLLLVKVCSQKPKRSLSVQKLQSNPSSSLFLDRIFQDRAESKWCFPLGHVLFFLWELRVDSTLQSLTSSAKGSYSLPGLQALQQAVPSFDRNQIEKLGPEGDSSPRQSLDDLVSKALGKETEIRAAFVRSKGLQRDGIRKVDEVRAHTTGLKTLQSYLKDPSNLVAIDKQIELRLEREFKLFSWMNRALEHQALRSEDAPGRLFSAGQDGRIPWEALVKLHDTCPRLERDDTGGLACLVMRVKDFHRSASAWQAKISNETQISLRGGKRRDSPMKGSRGGVDSEDTSKVGPDKLSELCSHSILLKVAMPREAAVQSMLEYSTEFESSLYEFLGQDYDGEWPDRAPYPQGYSLVEDGNFVVFRLTGSPLFQELKKKVSAISTVASNVFAETPGKATFEWISKAVEWIESVSSSFSQNTSGQLTLQGDLAEQLLHDGEAVLLDVPDDLRKTLSQHGISVSTNKEGKLTVKSKKKGAQYAVGATIIRWAPIILDALKSDLLRSRSWVERLESYSSDYRRYCEEYGHVFTDEATLGAHFFHRELGNLLHEETDLVVSPPDLMTSNARTIVRDLHTYLTTYSSSELKRKAGDGIFKVKKNVVSTRGMLRDALLNRLASSGGELSPPTGSDGHRQEASTLGRPRRLGSHPHYPRSSRYATREDLDRALYNIGATPERQLPQEAIASLCAVKAAEIESILFVLYKGKPMEYRVQASVLYFGLCGNVSLCLEVLTGKMSVSCFAKLTSEELPKQICLDNKSGSDLFQFSASWKGSRFSFSAHLVLESDCDPSDNSIELPDALSQTGTLSSDRVLAWVQDVKSKGPVGFLTYRLECRSGEELRTFLDFREKYSENDRLWLLRLNKEDWVFLFTPEFADLAREILGEDFCHPNSTYVVVVRQQKPPMLSSANNNNNGVDDDDDDGDGRWAKVSGLVPSMTLIETLPTFTGTATTNREFRAAYDAVQCVAFRQVHGGGPSNDSSSSNTTHHSPGQKRKRQTVEQTSGVTKSPRQEHLACLQTMRDTFHAATREDQASWCIENDDDKDGNASLPSAFLSASTTTTAPQRAYCSFVLQDDAYGAVTAFTAQHREYSTLPIRSDEAPQQTGKDTGNETDTKACRTYLQDPRQIFVTEPYWMFLGRNTSATPLPGRAEHTDSIQHHGTFHYQMAGSKLWKLRPTQELRDMCNDRDVALLDSYVHTVEQGDMFFINTRLWWHATELPGVADESCAGWSISFARDVYLDGLQPDNAADEFMSTIDAVFANATIPHGTILLTELEELPSTMGTSKERAKSNCEVLNVAEIDDEDGGEPQMALVATRDIVEGEFFVMFAATKS